MGVFYKRRRIYLSSSLQLGGTQVHVFKMKSQLSSFFKTFDVKFPIVQSPMAGASTVELAAIITNAGGLGSIPLGSASENPQVIENQVLKFQSLVQDEKLKRNMNLNFFTHEPPRLDQDVVHQEWLKKFHGYYKKEGIEISPKAESLTCPYPTFKSIDSADHQTIQTLIRLKPKVVSFHFGLPNLKVLKTLQDAGIKVFISATSLQEFLEISEAGADGVVLQGWEAGGHRGNFVPNDIEDEQLTTEELVEKVVDFIDTNHQRFASGDKAPFIVAAGGLYDGETIATVLNYGIAAVQLGTIWLPTKQATISHEHRNLFFVNPARETIMSPAISGRNLRTIESDYLKGLKKNSPLSTIPDYPLPYSIFKQLAADAKSAGVGHSYSAFLAGSNFHQSKRDTDDAAEVFEQILEELDSRGYHFKRYI